MSKLSPPPLRTRKSIQRARKKKKIPKKKIRHPRRAISSVIAGIVSVSFAILMGLVIEARHSSFYGEPLFEKVMTLAHIHLKGLPEDAEARARIQSGMPNLNLLPAGAVLPPDLAQRFTRLGIHFAYVQEDVRPGNGRYRCRATDIDRIPAVAWNIAAALYEIPDETLQSLDLRYIIFCGDLFQDGLKVGGFPVPVNDLMMLNLTHRTDARDIREFFLHEFYHLVEARHDIVKDPDWERLFGSGYYSSYKGHTGPENNRLGSGTFGFINRYSQTFPHEDRAEIFAMLMVSRPQLIQYIIDQQDEMLYAKVKYVAETARQRLGIKIDPL